MQRCGPSLPLAWPLVGAQEQRAKERLEQKGRYRDHSVSQRNGTIHVSGPLWHEMRQLVSSNSVPYFRAARSAFMRAAYFE